MRNNRERLLHILEAIERIEKYAAQGADLFLRDELIQNWAIHHIQIIGEAARALPQDFRDQHPEIPWNNIIGMRHILVHEYFGVDIMMVWQVISDNLPQLKKQIEEIAKSLP